MGPVPWIMTPEEFTRKMHETFGTASWSYELSKRTNINARTLERMGLGERPIPAEVARMVLLLHETRDFWKKGVTA